MCSVILLVQRFWEHYIPINLAKQLSCAQIWTHFQSKMPKMYPTAHKFQVSVMPAATYTQDPVTGAWAVTPGVSELIVTGTV